MATSSLSPPDPERHRDRVITWRPAVLTAIAGFMAGLVGGAFGFFGVLVSTNSETDRSRQDFLRTQNQAAFAQFLTDVDATYKDVGMISFPKDATVETLNHLQDDLNRLEDDRSPIQLLAGKPVTDASLEVWRVL